MKESKFTQVVNQVEVISTSDNSKHPAAVDSIFKLPDVVRTGAASRAELVAEDRTITRIGANTIFSFNDAKRRIDLDQGSLLFNAPKGKGGGTIHTAAATAAVLGTTIIVVTTPNGGFKVLTLEGVADVKFSNGEHRRIKAGQLIFVLPGGIPGPVLAFRLDQQVAGSLLVSGFTTALPSLPLIQVQIANQIHQIQTGRALDTGLLAGNTATVNTVQVINPVQEYNAVANPSMTTPTQIVNSTSGGSSGTGTNSGTIPTAPPGTIVPSGGGYLNPDGFVFTSSSTNSGPGPAYAMGPATATLSDAAIGTPTLDPTHVFTSDVTVSIPAQSFNGLVNSGFYARNVTINSPSIDFSPYNVTPIPANFLVFASENMNITANLTLSAFPTDLIFFAGGTLSISPGVTVTGNSTDLNLDSKLSDNLNSVTLQNTGGNLILESFGSVSLNNSTLNAALPGGAASVIIGNGNGSGSVSLNNTLVSSDNVSMDSPTTLTVSGTTPAAGKLTSTSAISLIAATGLTTGVDLVTPAQTGVIIMNNSAGTLTVNNGAQMTASTISMNCGNGITIDSVAPINASTMNVIGGMNPADVATVQNTDMSNLSSLAVNAYTVVLNNVNLSGSVILTSANGVLAPNPNTGAAVIPGDVNFKSAVLYKGSPAQQFIGAGITIK